MIYSHKPQRSGRSISSNTNNPPQDPPSPNKINLDDISIVSEVPVNTDLGIPDIYIEDTTPHITDICIEQKPITIIPKKKKQVQKPKIVKEKPIIKEPLKVPKISFFRRLLAKIRKIFGRK